MMQRWVLFGACCLIWFPVAIAHALLFFHWLRIRDDSPSGIPLVGTVAGLIAVIAMPKTVPPIVLGILLLILALTGLPLSLLELTGRWWKKRDRNQ